MQYIAADVDGFYSFGNKSSERSQKANSCKLVTGNWVLGCRFFNLKWTLQWASIVKNLCLSFFINFSRGSDIKEMTMFKGCI